MANREHLEFRDRDYLKKMRGELDQVKKRIANLKEVIKEVIAEEKMSQMGRSGYINYSTQIAPSLYEKLEHCEKVKAKLEKELRTKEVKETILQRLRKDGTVVIDIDGQSFADLELDEENENGGFISTLYSKSGIKEEWHATPWKAVAYLFEQPQFQNIENKNVTVL